MRIAIGTGTYNQILEVEDTLSIEKGSEDGQKYCGPRIYVINDPVPCWASIERNILTITVNITITQVNILTM